MLAVGDGLHHQRLGLVVAADQFDDDVDLGIVDDVEGIGHHRHQAAGALFRAFQIAGRDGHHFNAAAGAATDFFLVAAQHVECTGTDVADA